MPRPDQGTRLLRLLGILDMREYIDAHYKDERKDKLMEALHIQQRRARRDLTELDWERVGVYGDAALAEAEELVTTWAKRDAEANHPLSAGH